MIMIIIIIIIIITATTATTTTTTTTTKATINHKCGYKRITFLVIIFLIPLQVTEYIHTAMFQFWSQKSPSRHLEYRWLCVCKRMGRHKAVQNKISDRNTTINKECSTAINRHVRRSSNSTEEDRPRIEWVF